MEGGFSENVPHTNDSVYGQSPWIASSLTRHAGADSRQASPSYRVSETNLSTSQPASQARNRRQDTCMAVTHTIRMPGPSDSPMSCVRELTNPRPTATLKSTDGAWAVTSHFGVHHRIFHVAETGGDPSPIAVASASWTHTFLSPVACPSVGPASQPPWRPTRTAPPLTHCHVVRGI